MHTENKIKHHGYRLMSLASIGMLCVGLLTLFLMQLPWIPDSGQLGVAHWKLLGFDLQEFVHVGANGKWGLTLSALCVGTAYFLPFLALRHLGSTLYHDEALTLPVANAFRWLAHSILTGLLLQGLPDACMGFINGLVEGSSVTHVAPAHYVPHDFGVGATYIAIVAILCLYSVAHLMKLASAAADDSRSIV